MIMIAACLYLPEHITTVASRAWFYYAGDETASAGSRSSDIKDNFAMPGNGQVVDMHDRL